MRFLSITLRCYRIHRQLTVEFARELTLIGGPNECGKSTLVEALHRALFLKAKGNTEAHRAMESTLHGGRPEVLLRFEAASRTYELRKIFGSNGSTVLSGTGLPTLTGDAAETELSRLLRAEAPLNRRDVDGQWAHLWVWQGTSGGDPCAHVSSQQNALRPKLQAVGGDTLLSSATDARIAEYFAARIAALFTQRSQPTKQGPLGQAAAALAAAEQHHARAADRLAQLQAAIVEVEDCTRQLASVEKDERELEAGLAEASTKLLQLEALKRQEADEARAAEEAEKHAAGLQANHSRILSLDTELRSHEGAERTAAVAAAERRELHDAAVETCRLAEAEHTRALETMRRARAVADLHNARVEQFRAAARVAELTARDQSLTARRAELDAHKKSLAGYPVLDPAGLKKLAKLQTEQVEADARLKAMAARIELVSSKDAVLIDQNPLAPGAATVITTDTEIRIGHHTVLQIRPGGGTSLDEARRDANNARTCLNSALAEFGLEDLNAAHALAAKREMLSSKIAELEAALTSKDVATLPRQLEQARTEAAARDGEVERRAALLPELPLASDITTAATALDEANAAVHIAEEAETTATRELNAARRRAETIAAEHTKARELWTRLQHQATTARVQLELLRKDAGSDDERALQLATAKQNLERTRSALAATREAIKALQPEILQRTHARLQRAREEQRRQHAATLERRALAQGKLVSNGAEDPVAAASTAHAALQRARAHHDQVALEAKALQLVHDEFVAAQRELADRYIRPLAERISGYLECVFGAGTRAVLAHSPEGFSDLALVRGVSTVPFATLSGGTREQVAAAARLALAEILASDFDGALPVCFDDAFAYSDPERNNTLQAMLDLAASRGLQVIVLSCNPGDYRTLGARTMLLSRHAAPDTNATTGSGQTFFATPAAVAPDEPPRAVAATTQGSDDAVPNVAMVLDAVGDLGGQMLAKLAELSGTAGNQMLRAALGWDEATYLEVKRSLLATHQIKVGKGRGGSVALVSHTASGLLAAE